MKKLTLTAMLLVLVTSALCIADTSHTDLSEEEIISQMAEADSFIGENPSHDPFRPIITRPEIQIKKVIPVDPREDQKREIKPVIEPLLVRVTGICGNDRQRQAIINFKNEEFTVQSGDVINGIFRIVDISAEKLVVYSIREQRRHSFSL